jgi:predicted nucleic acid-binding Zn ribbon protein
MAPVRRDRRRKRMVMAFTILALAAMALTVILPVLIYISGS